MATTWKAPTWRMPNEKNQSKFENYGLTFDGSNEYADLNSGVSMVLLPTNEPRPTSGGNVTLAISPKSYSCWFKVDTTGTKTIFSSAPTGGGYHVKLDVNSSNLLEFSLRTPSPTYTNTTGTTTIATDTWYHVLITVDGTNNKLYVNGTLEGTTACSGNMIYYRHTSSSNPKNLIGGYWTTSSTQDFDGSISDLVIFNYALSSTQISSLYNSGSPINPMTLKPAPIAYYPLGGNASTGGDSTNTLSVPNIAVPDASVFEFTPPDYINLGNPEELQITGAITLSLWFNSTTATGGFITKSDGGGYFGNNAQKVFEVGLLSNTLYWIISDGTSSNTLSHSFSSYLDGNWHHLMVTWDGTTNAASMKLFIDGSEVADNQATISAIQNKSNDVVISSKGVAYDYTGKISNVAIWNSDQSSEISNIYNSGVPATTYTNTPTAWYKLDQSANWEADAASTWQIPDAVSSYPQSFNFDGSGEHIDVSSFDNALLSDGDISFSLWCKLETTGTYQYILSSEHTGTIAGINIAMHPNTKLSFSRAQDIANTQNGTGYTVLGFSLGNWHHLCGTYNATSGELKAYVDGDLKSTTNDSADARSASTALKIGGLSTYATLYAANGQISNVQIWDSALSSSQVTQLYNNGVPLTTAIATDNLKAWYKLSDNEIWDGTNWSVENQKYPAGFDSALEFTKANTDTINYGVTSSWDNGDFSFGMWFFNDGELGLPFTNAFDGAAVGFNIGQFANGNTYIKRKTRATSGTDSGQIVDSNGSYVDFGFEANKWQHIGVSHNTSTNKMRVYANGQFHTEFNGSTHSSNLASTALFIGARSDTGGSSYAWEGELSNIQVFNSVLLDTEFQNMYNNGTPLVDMSSFTTLTHWWKLDNTITGIQDSKGSLNGTNNGATKVNTFVSAVAGTSSGMTEQNLVNNNVSALNGESSGMTSANLVTSTLTRQVPYNSYSLNFDGTNDYIDCTDNDMFSFGNGTTDTAFSLSTWINMSTVADFVPIAKDSSGAREWTIRMVSGEIHFYLIDNSVVNGWIGRKNSSTPATDTWFNLTCTYDGSGSSSGIKIYLDGTRVDDTDYNGAGAYVAMENTSAIVSIGMQQNGTVSQPGKISNVSIFNEELTSTEVVKLYNSGVPSDLSNFNPSPIAWWSLGSDSYFNGANYICPDLVSTNNGTSSGMDANALIGNAPNSTGNGTSTNMAIDANLTGNAPNSSNNSFSVNMDYTDRETSVPS